MLRRATFIVWTFGLFGLLAAQETSYPADTVYSPVFCEPPSLPAWHESIIDSTLPSPVRIYRLTRYNREWDWYPTHDYAKIQPWNADGSLIKFSSALLYDARTGNILRSLPGDLWESRWAHTDPELIYSFRPDGTVKKYWPRRDSTHILLRLTGYESVRLGPGEGNTSWDDRRVSLIGKSGTDMEIVNIALDTPRVLAARRFPEAWGESDRPRYIDWVSVSPSGRWTLIMWNTRLTSAEHPFQGHYGVELYTTDSLRFVRRLSPYGNHGDFNYTSAGSEVFVQFYGPSGTIHAYLLARDSILTVHTHPDFGYGDAHLSGQNYLRPGWIYASTDPSKGGLMVAIKLDGSQTVEYFGHHFSSAANYAKSPMPVPSPRGEAVMFKSDFGHSENPDEVYDFIATALPLQATGHTALPAFRLFPNPFTGFICLDSNDPAWGITELRQPDGRLIRQWSPAVHCLQGAHHLRPGFYLIGIRKQNVIHYVKVIKSP